MLAPEWDLRLARLRAEPKFAPDETYTGYQPEAHRARAAALVDGLIDGLRADLPSDPSRELLRSRLRDTFDWFRLSDTEDRDRCAQYLSDVLEALGLPPQERDPYAWVGRFDLLAPLTHPQLEG